MRDAAEPTLREKAIDALAPTPQPFVGFLPGHPARAGTVMTAPE